MIVIYISLEEDERFDVPSIVAALQVSFPGTTITADNSFEAERERTAKSIAEIAATEKPLKNPDLIIRRITNKESVLGPGVDIAVPLEASVLNGHVWAKEIRLFTDDELSSDAIELMEAFLVSLGVGAVKIAR